jgi:hypothetical protein
VEEEEFRTGEPSCVIEEDEAYKRKITDTTVIHTIATQATALEKRPKYHRPG